MGGAANKDFPGPAHNGRLPDCQRTLGEFGAASGSDGRGPTRRGRGKGNGAPCVATGAANKGPALNVAAGTVYGATSKDHGHKVSQAAQK